MFTRFRTSFKLLTATLLSVELLDELLTGLTVIGLPLLRAQLGLTYTQIGLLFSISALVGMILEPLINLLSDLGVKRPWILCGLFGMAACALLASYARQFVWLALALALSKPAGSAAIGLSQAALIDLYPDSTRAMTRWTLLGSIGDLLSPLAVTLLLSLHAGWSQMCWLTALLWSLVALLLLPQHFPRVQRQHDETTSEHTSLLANLRTALRHPVLLRWVVLAILPTMVDEVFLSFATLYLHDRLHANQVTVGVMIVLLMLSSLSSLIVLERWLLKRYQPRRLLLFLALPVLVGMIVFLSTNALWLAACALCLIGMGAASWYPLAKGQAYACLPDHSAIVLALTSLGGPFEMLLPGIVGLVAGRFGLVAGLSVLASAPLWVILLVGTMF